MKHILTFMLLYTAVPVQAQEWVAKVDLNFTHMSYAYENISSATVTVSGYTKQVSSENGWVTVVIPGTGAISGHVEVSASGLAWEPYNQEDTIRMQPMSAHFSGYHDESCEVGFFEQTGQPDLVSLFIWVRIYPRLEIENPVQECGRLSLITNTCSDGYTWEVSEHPTEGYTTITGKNTPSLTITPEELTAIGHTNPYGRKYFRVTGYKHTTSPIQVVDIYYPGPAAWLTVKSPRCYNQYDGSVRVNISSSLPSAINDFVATIFEANEGHPIRQEFISDASEMTIAGIPPGNFLIRIENNSSIDSFGSCWTEYPFFLDNPEPVTISAAKRSDFNGYQVRCAGDADGAIRLSPSGGTGEYSFEWKPGVSMSAEANELRQGVYQVKVNDTHGCESEWYSYEITEPARLNASLISTGGSNGFDVSCHDTSDGGIFADVTGGVAPYTAWWSDAGTKLARIGLAEGAYAVTVTDENGCTVDDSIHLQSPEPIDFQIETTGLILCPGDHSGELQINSVRNALGDVFYQWSSGETAPFIRSKPADTYAATVTDSQGCSTTKYYQLAEPAPIQIDRIVVQSPPCPGSCDGQLRVKASGGTGRLQLKWSSGETAEVLQNLCAGEYIVIATDSNHCVVSSTLVLDPSNTQTINLGDSAMVCRGQTHTLDVNPYQRGIQWGGNNGFASTQSTVSITEPGLYWVEVTSAAGCLLRDTFLLKVSVDPVNANFLMASNAVVEDTVAMADISWPLPQSVAWTFPPGVELLDDLEEIVYAIFDEPGTYEVTLSAIAGQCSDHITKTIVVREESHSGDHSGRLAEEQMLKEFSIYPNPNSGAFNLVANFVNETAMTVTIRNVLTSLRIYEFRDQGRARYEKKIELGRLSSGTYSLQLSFDNKIRYLRFIVR